MTLVEWFFSGSSDPMPTTDQDQQDAQARAREASARAVQARRAADEAARCSVFGGAWDGQKCSFIQTMAVSVPGEPVARSDADGSGVSNNVRDTAIIALAGGPIGLLGRRAKWW